MRLALAALILAWWIPPPSTSWQWQLTGTIDTGLNVAMFDVDLVDTPAATLTELHARGRKVVCYISAGTWENWRPDAARYPASVLGRAVDGWPAEKWVDIRQLDTLRPILEARLDLCRDKGFDAVEPDNVDGYANASGFPLTAADQLRFNRWLASAAHTRGLSVGLKNDLGQVSDLVNNFDFAVNEQCFQYKECDRLAPFVAAGKAVFEVEYQLQTSAFCADAVRRKFSAMRKNLDLNAFRDPCPAPKPSAPKNLRIIR